MNYFQKCLKKNYTDDQCIYYYLRSYFPKIRFETELIFSDSAFSSTNNLFVQKLENLSFCQTNQHLRLKNVIFYHCRIKPKFTFPNITKCWALIPSDISPEFLFERRKLNHFCKMKNPVEDSLNYKYL
jgi:hypothetical protein